MFRFFTQSSVLVIYGIHCIYYCFCKRHLPESLTLAMWPCYRGLLPGAWADAFVDDWMYAGYVILAYVQGLMPIGWSVCRCCCPFSAAVM